MTPAGFTQDVPRRIWNGVPPLRWWRRRAWNDQGVVGLHAAAVEGDLQQTREAEPGAAAGRMT